VTCPNTWSLVGEHNQPGESYEAAVKRGLMEELSVSWDDGSVKSWFRLEPRASLLDIHYLRPDGVRPDADTST
jgi:ADP-ribose pyrophosphatase YjhB (NUDIX family)